MSRNILLADDSLTIQKVVELTFMEREYEIVSVSNGDDALMKLGDFEPDIVVADVHMPGADGYEVCRQVKGQGPEVPVLLLVGTFEPFDEDAAKAAGADAYLKKPFDSQELMQLVESLLSDRDSEAPESENADVSFESLEETGDTEVTPVEGEEPTTAVDPITLSEASDTEVIETFGEISPLEETEMGDSETGFEPAGQGQPTAQSLSDEDVERVAKRVVELIGDQVVREISWDVIPDLAEIVIKDRIRELEGQID